MKVRFTEAFFEDKLANTPFIPSVERNKIYEAEMAGPFANFTHRVHVDGYFVQQAALGFVSWDGVVPAHSYEIEYVYEG